MKIIVSWIFVCTTLIILSCKQATKQAGNPQPVTETVNPAAQQNIEDTLGEIIFTIDFKIKATGEDLKIFDDGFIPWISIDNPKPALKNLVDADNIVLPYQAVKLIIDYPLNNPASFDITIAGQGFSRKQLITLVSDKYHDIYKLEESTAATKTIPPEKRKGLINRNQTDGKYGIWGHDISDLDLSEIEVHKNSKGQIILIPGIES